MNLKHRNQLPDFKIYFSFSNLFLLKPLASTHFCTIATPNQMLIRESSTVSEGKEREGRCCICLAGISLSKQ